LLISPGRGLFIYNPILIFALLAFPAYIRKNGAIAVVAILFALITLIFHARFWTWHGGWTPGTRFMLPALPFLMLAIPAALQHWRDRPALFRITFSAAVMFGFVVQVLQVVVNPLDFNNEIFGFLRREENPFLFVPQYSSLGGSWLLLCDGAWRWKNWIVDGTHVKSGFLINVLGAVLLVFATLKIFHPLNLEYLRPVVKDFKSILFLRPVAVTLLILIISGSVLWIGKGPRGLEKLEQGEEVWEVHESCDFLRFRASPRLNQSIQNSPIFEWRGWLQAPITGQYRFAAKVRGRYELTIGSQTLFANSDPGVPQHLPGNTIDLIRGQIYPIHSVYSPPPDGGLFYIYWTMPGEGVALAPIDREYLFPREPGAASLFITRVWRKLWLLVLLFMVPLLLFLFKPKTNQQPASTD
jgi:hypothetical protein